MDFTFISSEREWLTSMNGSFCVAQKFNGGNAASLFEQGLKHNFKFCKRKYKIYFERGFISDELVELFCFDDNFARAIEFVEHKYWKIGRKKKCLDLSFLHFRVLRFIILVFSRAYSCDFSIFDCSFSSINFRVLIFVIFAFSTSNFCH